MVKDREDMPEEPGTAREVPGVLVEAEGVKFWTEMGGAHFADFLPNDLKTVIVEAKEYQIAVTCPPETGPGEMLHFGLHAFRFLCDRVANHFR